LGWFWRLDWFGIFSWFVKLFCCIGDGFALAQAHNIRTRGAEKPKSKIKGNKRFFLFPGYFILTELSCSSTFK